MRGPGVKVSFPNDFACVKLYQPKNLARLRAPNMWAAGLTGGAAGELAFPHVLAAGTGHGFRGLPLLQRLAAYRTIFAPHGSTLALLHFSDVIQKRPRSSKTAKIITTNPNGSLGIEAPATTLRPSQEPPSASKINATSRIVGTSLAYFGFYGRSKVTYAITLSLTNGALPEFT
jgi:hypothetical protein